MPAAFRPLVPIVVSRMGARSCCARLAIATSPRLGLEHVLPELHSVADGARYAEAIALLVDLHGREFPESLPVGDETYALPVYDAEAMTVEVELALDWYAPAVAPRRSSTGARVISWGLARAFGRIIAGRRPGRCATYHSPNLIGSRNGEG